MPRRSRLRGSSVPWRPARRTLSSARHLRRTSFSRRSCSVTYQEDDVRLVATEYLSLDGVFEEPGQWSFPFFNDEARQFKWTELQASDALLLGRRTYEGFAAA